VAVGTAGIRKSGKLDPMLEFFPRIAGSDLLDVRELPLVESSCAASAAFSQVVSAQNGQKLPLVSV